LTKKIKTLYNVLYNKDNLIHYFYLKVNEREMLLKLESYKFFNV